MARQPDESRDDVPLTNLDQPLFDEAGATKRDLVDYLDAIRDRIIPVLTDRPLSVIRVHRGQEAFMQKNVPKYTPDWIRTVSVWAEASHRDVSYALCNDRRTLLWFANQRAIEYHPTLSLVDHPEHPTHLVIDLDPPEGAPFAAVVAVAHLVRRALTDLGLDGAVKTSGSKGIHIFVPIAESVSTEDAAAATRAIAADTAALDPNVATTAFLKDDREGKVFVDPTRVGGATVVAAYSPRVRPGVPVSFPIGWDDLDDVAPLDFTIHTAPDLLGGSDPWAASMPAPQRLPDDLVGRGHEIPVPRVQAMHEGRRRARARARAPETASRLTDMTNLPDRTATALVVVDMQRGVVADAHERDAVVANIADLVERARASDTPVIWVQHEGDELVTGSEPWQYVDELEPASDEPVVHKRYGDSFEETDLEHVLAERKVGHLVVAGAQSDACIRTHAARRARARLRHDARRRRPHHRGPAPVGFADRTRPGDRVHQPLLAVHRRTGAHGAGRHDRRRDLRPADVTPYLLVGRLCVHDCRADPGSRADGRAADGASPRDHA